MPAIAGLALVACGSDTTNNGTGTSPSASTSASSSPAPCVAGSITASGSTALQPLVKKAADLYQAKCQGATITVSGGGSSTGLSNVASGVSDIGDSDVPVSNAKSVDPTTVKDNQVAVAVFAIIANPGAGVTNITTQQARDIFAGTITNWKTVGGKDVPITLIERKPGSGTRLAFDKDIMAGTPESTTPAGTEDSTQTVLTKVGGAGAPPGAVSYIVVSSADNTVVALSLDGSKPTADDVKNGKYKYFAHEHMYTKSTPPPLAAAFIGYILSDEFQTSQVSALGYLPVATTKEQSAADQ
ncbi:MAG TPA: substrate-binding domain-containing protein [Candidatus Dormibacteraeota bacterium]|nr:substrate-binding domain-containing protein [Candidatus Dormibacteraeota bacterium]